MTQQVAERSSTDCNREVVTKCEVSIKKTGVQRVQRTVREVYLREDIPCGIRNCSRCTEFINDADEDSLTSHIGLPLNLRVQEGEGMPAPSKGPVSPKLADQVQNNSTSNVCTGGDNLVDKVLGPIVVPDLDVLYSQLDFLAEDPAVENCLLLGTLLAEARRRDRRTAFKLGAMFDASISRHTKCIKRTNNNATHVCTTHANAGTSKTAIVIDDDEDGAPLSDDVQSKPDSDDRAGKRVFVLRDEFHKETYSERLHGESAEERISRSTLSTMKWLVQHVSQYCTVPVQVPTQLAGTSQQHALLNTGTTWSQRFQDQSRHTGTDDTGTDDTGTDSGAVVVDLECNDDSDDQVCTVAGTVAGTDMTTVNHRVDGGRCVLLLVSTKKRKVQAAQHGVPVMLVSEFVEDRRLHGYAGCGELLSEFLEDSDDAQDDAVDADHRPAKRARTTSSSTPEAARRRRVPVYPAHLKESEVNAGIHSQRLYQGTLRMPPSTSMVGFVKCPNPAAQGSGMEYIEYRISGRPHLNRAFHGDVVVIEPLNHFSAVPVPTTVLPVPTTVLPVPEANDLSRKAFYTEDDNTGNDVDGAPSKNEAKVVGIIRRNWREFAGTLRPLEEAETRGASTFVKIERTFVPVDPKVPFIVIKTRQSSELEGKRLFVAVDGWNRYSRLPLGHWTRIIGTYGNTDTENELILRENGVITRDFSESALRCLPPVTWSIPVSEIQRRLDIRDQFVCSVDPPGCKDIDDALSIKKLDDSHFEVGVHIADVTHFVRPDSSLDLEAAARCTTVYLVDRRTDMLPGLLTTQLCSLVANEDRLAFSVFMKITPEGEVVSYDFAKTIIRSRAAFTYAEAQMLIDDRSDKSAAAIKLRHLYKVSQTIRDRRTACGALSLASEEATFTLDMETHDLTDVSVYELRGTNRMIEDYMCLANTTVAQYILNKFPNSAVLRRHPAPKMSDLESLKKLLAAKGYPDFDFGTSKQLATSLDVTTSKDDPYFNKLIRILTTRCMNAASYFCTGDLPVVDYPHYGLGLQRYTHFTSPIRRYADVLVHRLLAAALGLDRLPEQLVQKHRVVDQCQLMNEKTYNATIASRDAVKFTSYLFFKSKGEQTANAVVTTVKENGVLVQIPRYAIQSLVKLKSSDYDFDADLQKLVAKPNLLVESTDSMVRKLPSVQIFDKVRVRIFAKGNLFRNQLVVEILEMLPPFAPV